MVKKMSILPKNKLYQNALEIYQMGIEAIE